MRYRRGLAAVALASAILLAGCLGGITADANEQVPGSGDGQATIAVGGQGSVDAEPDAATVQLRVVASGDDPEAVRDSLASDADAVREGLLAYGLDEEQITTRGFSIRENPRARHEPDRDLDRYEGYHRIEIELDDTGAVGEVIDVAVESGDVQIDHVRFELSDDRREALREEALQAAMVDARGEAEVVAAAEGLAVGSAVSITTDRVEVRPVRATVAYEPAADAGASTRVEPGDVTVTASVQVVYNASDAGSA